MIEQLIATYVSLIMYMAVIALLVPVCIAVAINR